MPTRFDARRDPQRTVIDLLKERFLGRATSPVCEAGTAHEGHTNGQPDGRYATAEPMSTDATAALGVPVVASSSHSGGAR